MLPVHLSCNASFYRVSNSAQVEIDRMFQWDKASVPPNRKKGDHFLPCNFGSFSYGEETCSPLKDASGKDDFEEVQKITVQQARNKSRNTPRPGKTCFCHSLRQQNGNSSTRLSHKTTYEI